MSLINRACLCKPFLLHEVDDESCTTSCVAWPKIQRKIEKSKVREKQKKKGSGVSGSLHTSTSECDQLSTHPKLTSLGRGEYLYVYIYQQLGWVMHYELLKKKGSGMSGSLHTSTSECDQLSTHPKLASLGRGEYLYVYIYQQLGWVTHYEPLKSYEYALPWLQTMAAHKNSVKGS